MSPLAALLLASLAASGPVQTERHVERDLPEALAGAARFVVVHSFGECKVLVAGAKEKPRARLDLVASGAGDAAERHYVELADVAFAAEPGVTAIRSLFPPREQQPQGLSFAANLTVWLPEGAALVLDNRHGRTLVEGRAGDVKATSLLGPVELRHVRGSVEVDVQFEQATLADVTGDATVRGKSAAVTAERIGGHVDVRTNGYPVRIDGAGSARVENSLKPIDVQHVVGDASIFASFCDVTAKAIGGTLTIEGGGGTFTVDGVGRSLSIQHKNGKVDARDVKGSATVAGNLLADVRLADVGGDAEVRCPFAPVRITNVAGKLVVENSMRPLEIVNARGDVEASARGGLLRLQWTKLPGDGADHAIVLEGENGGIELLLPDGASVALDLTSTIGQIDCALPGMSFVQSAAVRSGKLVLKDSKVKLQATCVGGAIRVRRAGAN